MPTLFLKVQLAATTSSLSLLYLPSIALLTESTSDAGWISAYWKTRVKGSLVCATAVFHYPEQEGQPVRVFLHIWKDSNIPDRYPANYDNHCHVLLVGFEGGRWLSDSLSSESESRTLAPRQRIDFLSLSLSLAVTHQTS